MLGFLRRLFSKKRAWFARADALRQQGRRDEAITELRAIIAKFPDFYDARFELGVNLDEIGDVRGALDAYDAASQLRDDDPDLYWNRGHTLLQGGFAKEAVIIFDCAAKLDERPHMRLHVSAALACADDLAKANMMMGGKNLRWTQKIVKEGEKTVQLVVLAADNAVTNGIMKTVLDSIRGVSSEWRDGYRIGIGSSVLKLRESDGSFVVYECDVSRDPERAFRPYVSTTLGLIAAELAVRGAAA